MIKRTCKTRKNPSVASDLITTSIKKVGVRYQVKTFVGGTELFKLERKFDSYEDANKAAGIAKNTLVKELSKAKRKNPRVPKDELENSFKQAIGKSVALPDNPMDSFELGRLYGIQTSLENYCGALNFLRRRAILKTINREISNSLATVARKVAVRGEGIGGPVPFVKTMKG